MKQIAKSLVIAGALAVAGSAVAEFGDFTPYVGADLQLARMKAKSPYDTLLSKSFPGANLYLGTKVHENFGVEAGYSLTKTQKRTADYPARFDGLGATGAGAGAQAGAKTTLRRNSAFFDLVGFLPVMDCTEVFASVGYGYVMPKLSIKQADGTAIKGFDLRNQHVLRVGLGASYMVTEMVGLRAKVGYEGTKTTHFKKSQDHANLVANGLKTKNPLKNTMTMNLGAFVKF